MIIQSIPLRLREGSNSSAPYEKNDAERSICEGRRRKKIIAIKWEKRERIGERREISRWERENFEKFISLSISHGFQSPLSVTFSISDDPLRETIQTSTHTDTPHYFLWGRIRPNHFCSRPDGIQFRSFYKGSVRSGLFLSKPKLQHWDKQGIISASGFKPLNRPPVQSSEDEDNETKAHNARCQNTDGWPVPSCAVFS